MKHYSRVTLLVVLIQGCFVSPTCAARFIGSSQRFRQSSKNQHSTTLSCNKDPIIQVREVLPTKLQNEIDPELNQDDVKSLRDGKSTSSRRWIWWGKDRAALVNQDESSRTNTINKSRIISKDKEEHPLRTDLWGLQVQWFRRGGSRRPMQSHKTLSMEFHKNGQCRLLSDADANITSPSVLGIGSWNSRPYAVWFSVSCEEGKYICTAQLHPNPFGKHPKMQQGTILFERKHMKQHAADVVEYDEERDRLFISPRPLQWFRPIVGKFTAVGIGADTLDYSYSKREKRM